VTKIRDIGNSLCIVRMLDVLYENEPMNVMDWAKASRVGHETIRAYARQLISNGEIHIVRLDMNHMGHKVVRVYGYGPGEGRKKVERIHKQKIEREFIPVPKIPAPDQITAALMGFSAT